MGRGRVVRALNAYLSGLPPRMCLALVWSCTARSSAPACGRPSARRTSLPLGGGGRGEDAEATVAAEVVTATVVTVHVSGNIINIGTPTINTSSIINVTGITIIVGDGDVAIMRCHEVVGNAAPPLAFYFISRGPCTYALGQGGPPGGNFLPTLLTAIGASVQHHLLESSTAAAMMADVRGAGEHERVTTMEGVWCPRPSCPLLLPSCLVP